MKKYIIYSLILLSAALLAGCEPLKKGYGIDNPEQYSRIYLDAAYRGLKTYTLTDNAQPIEIGVYANYAGVLALESDVAVTIAPDFSMVARYNAENHTAFKPLHQSCFTLTRNTAVIAAGTTISSDKAVLSVDPRKFLDNDLYLLPLRIVSVSDPSLPVNPELEVLYLAISCTADKVSYTTDPLLDFSISPSENW